MVGGTDDGFARAEPILAKMGKAVIHAGDAGAGQGAKICNNMLLGASMVATCETLALAQKLGLDPQKFFDIASVSSGQCWSLTSYAPRSEEHTSELQSLMRISYAVFCLKKKKTQ